MKSQLPIWNAAKPPKTEWVECPYCFHQFVPGQLFKRKYTWFKENDWKCHCSECNTFVPLPKRI